jgi:hypothetical protein
MTTLFERLSKGRPQPAEERQRKDDPQLLLDFLQKWPRPVISSRDVRIWGPKSIRDRESAIRSAQILAAHGFLIPIAARKWRVVRDPLVPGRSP